MPQACRDCGAECQDWGDGSGKRPEELPGISREWETDSLSGGGSELDQPVEGVLVFARNPKAARNLSAQITAGKMEKSTWQ